MAYRCRLLLALLAFTVLALNAFAGSALAADAARLTVTVAGQERSYRLLDGHQGSGPAPLVIALHGGGGNGEGMIGRWADKARAAGLVVAAPDGIGRLGNRGTWNAGGCCGEALRDGVDDIRFIAAVIDDLTRRLPVDPHRVYVAGFSNGGMLAHRLALAMPERFAAVAVVAGALFGGETPPRLPVPILLIHGLADDVVPVAGGMSPTRLVARSQSQPFLPLRETLAFWRRADGCTGQASPGRTTAARLETYGPCADRTTVALLTLADGGHAWPPGATDEIWSFFARFRR